MCTTLLVGTAEGQRSGCATCWAPLKRVRCIPDLKITNGNSAEAGACGDCAEYLQMHALQDMPAQVLSEECLTNWKSSLMHCRHSVKLPSMCMIEGLGHCLLQQARGTTGGAWMTGACKGATGCLMVPSAAATAEWR